MAVLEQIQEDHHQLEQQKTKGKRKIPIEPIVNKTRKQVTFSKRRGGLFKKASELCSLCDAKIAVVTFSGAGKLFCFGHPSADEVIHNYLNAANHGPNPCFSNGDGNREYCNYALEYKEVLRQIEVEKREGSGAVNSSNGSVQCGGFWWDEPIDHMGITELEQYRVALEVLRNQVASKVDEINRTRLINNNSNSNSNNNNAMMVPQSFEDGLVDQKINFSEGFDFSHWVNRGVA